MIVHYHEASVITSVVPTRGKLKADDLHRMAWRLHSADKDVKRPRPFIFRAEPLSERRWLFTVRSDEPFHGAVPHSLSFQVGQEIEFELAVVPRYRQKGVEKRLPDTAVPERVSGILARYGLSSVQAPRLMKIGVWPLRPGTRMTLCLMSGHCRARVEDETQFAQAYLDGAGPYRGYGAGLIQLCGESLSLASCAA